MNSRGKKDDWKTTFHLLVDVTVCAAIILFGVYIANQQYVKYDDKSLFADTAVMDIRPNAPGSAAALLEKHGHHCWTDEHSLGDTDAVILRKKPNSPYIYTKKPILIDRAIKQGAYKMNQGLDGVLAFCTDKITKPRAKKVPGIKLSF